MDILDYLAEDHQRLRAVLGKLSDQLTRRLDDKGMPAGWTLRSHEEVVATLRLLLPALLAHEDLEEKLLFQALRAEGVEDDFAFKKLGAEHHELESLVEGLTSVVSGMEDRPREWVVVAAMRLIEALLAHMAREEYEVFPIVRSTLTRRQLLELGRRAEAILHPLPS